MRRSASEKMEVINIVRESEPGVNRTLKELGISKSTFYEWYSRYLEYGYDGLKPKKTERKHFWNKIPEKERQKVIEHALDRPELSPREIACDITDKKGWFISESSVYRILKERGLITSPAWIVMQACDEFKDKTTAPNEMWQTDFTYLKVILWGWFYLSTVLDDFSRYIVHWRLCSTMTSDDAARVVGEAKDITGITPDKTICLLSDNGPCYIGQEFKEFLIKHNITHVRGKPFHPQTQGKIERYHRTMKNVIKLENYYLPEDLEQNIQKFVDYYNNERYHESLNNLTPADVYFGRNKEILAKRKEIKKETLIMRRKQYQRSKIKQLTSY